MIKVPDSAVLKEPLCLDRDVVKARKAFYELAATRTTHRSQSDHFAFERAVFGDDWQQSGASYVLLTQDVVDNGKIGILITALEISINGGFFGGAYQDLIPYSEAHEFYEAWLRVKTGTRPQSFEQSHLLARRRQFEMAMRDGKAEKLLDVIKMEEPEIAKELDYAYQVARRKVK